MSKKIRVVKHYSGVYSGVGADSQPVLSKSVCAAMLAGAMVLGGGVFVSSPAYADGYVDGTGNNIYYGYKTDASYTEARFHIEVDYYDTLDHAIDGGTEGKDPLGKFVRVHYLSNCKKEGGTADDWRFRPMWWFGVPKGLQNVQNITYTRVEKMTNVRGNQQFVPAGSSQFTFTDTNGYGVASKKTYPTPKQWKGISNFYFDEQNVLASKGWKQLLGLNGGKYDNTGNTESQWGDYQKETDGLQGIFVDWESAGQRFYDMTYVGEMTKAAWENRDANPLRFAAGVYRFAGNWHYAVGQKHNTPKIADHLKLVYPEVTKVKKLDALSNYEKGQVKEAIEKANRGKAGTQTLFDELVKDDQDGIVINNDGSATITFKDNTTRTMPASLLVTKDETDKDKYKPTLPDATPVVNPNALTEDDKKAVIAAFKKANPDDSEFSKHLAKDNAIAFDKDGKNLVVTYEDGSKATIPASELVFQGPKISDWAPYVVPDVIEVDDLTKLTGTDITNIIKAFDDANKGITPYDEAKEKNTEKKAPVSVDSKTGDATITWADGSKTTIAAWQFLKQKPKAPSPEPQPPVPTPAAEKEFIVEAPKTQTRVKFDPFKMTDADLTNQTNVSTLNGAKTLYTGEKGKDAKDPSKKVNIKSVEYSVDNGTGYITFKADGYKDAKYPMSVFFKKDPGTQTPQTPSTETKTETDTEHPENTFTYKVTKTEIDGGNPTAPDAVKALKQFVRDNYDNVKDSDLANVTDSITISTAWTPKPGTVHMGAWDNTSNSDPVTSIQLSGDFGIQVNGHQWMEDEGWSAGMEGTLFTIKPSDLYVKKSSTQHPTDTTIEDLKKQAKDLLNKRKNTDNLSNEDLKRAGITDPDQLNDSKIDSMAQGTTAEKDLRDLIRKLTDAKKADYKYNTDPYEADKGPSDTDFSVTDDMFKGAVKKFLHANYDDSKASEDNKIDNLTLTSNSATLTGKGWTPKEGTSDLELNSDTVTYGITTVVMNGDGKSVDFKNGDTVLFTVPADKLFKKKTADPTPAPTPDALAQMKKDAEQQIDRNPNLTKEQKEDYKKQIGDATTADKIKEILKSAADKGKENANSSDPNTQQTINNNKGGGDAKKDAEKKQKEKEDKKQEEQKNQELQDKKKKASEQIDKLDNLTKEEKDKLKEKLNGNDGDATKPGAKTPEEVQQILDEANNLNEAHKDVSAGALPFLSHGNANSDDDKALKELIGADPAQKDSTLTALEADLAKKDPAATAEEIKNALDAAKRQNAINEENAKNAGIAKLEAKKAELDAAYNALTDEQKAKAKDKYEAATKAIDDAKNTVNSATKPSDIKNAVDGVKTSFDAANKAIEDAKGKRDTTGNTNDDQNALKQEKEKQIERISNSGLSDEEKKKAIEDINAATKLGDPTGIADRALKAKKIEDAKKQIAALDHLNNAQKKAYEDIINSTDAHNIKDDDGKDTGKDDIDNALADAIATDHAMERLEKLKEIADKFAKGDKYKGLQEGNEQKKAFDDAATAAGAVLDKANGDPKDADQVNELYKDLLKAMQAIDDKAKGAGVITDALQAEVDNDSKLKPTPADPNDSAKPATPGDSLYTTASKEKKEAFDKALSDAEAALNKAKEDNADQAKPDSTPRTPEQEAAAQKAVDDALQKLEEARKALDGVDTTALQNEIGKDNTVKDLDKYKYADKSKTDAFDQALKDAQDLIKNLTTPSADGTTPKYGETTLDSKENKQKALDDALAKLKAAEEALDGKKPTPGSGSEAGYGVNDNAPTTVDKGELNVQIQGAESDSQPGNAGNGNAGAGVNSGNAGNAANTNAANANANNANGASSAAVNAAVENNPAVKQADAQVAKAQAALDAALAEAKKVAADPNATQAQVDAAAVKLADARKALADAQANAAKVRAAVRSRVIKGMRSRGSASTATGANVATAGLMATMIAAIGGAFVTRRMRTKHANRD